jgi:hypothetical protein
MFEDYEEMNNREKRLIRENTIRSMMLAAFRIDCHESANVTYEAIRRHCPEFSPRQRAMVRSIAVNKGIVDDSPEWN